MFIRHTVTVLVEQTYEVRDGEALEKRNATLLGALITTFKVAVVVLAGTMVIAEVGINIGALLAGMGIVGLAVGFGSQNLIKNMISGIFILLEDQYRKGDLVKVSGISGVVEEVNLCRTVLRDLDGALHYIPNGEISVASNFTKPHSRINIDIPFSYDVDIENIIDALNRTGRELAGDPNISQSFVEPLKVLGIDEFGETRIKIRVGGEVKPLKHWEVAREFRRRVLKEGILKRA